MYRRCSVVTFAELQSWMCAIGWILQPNLQMWAFLLLKRAAPLNWHCYDIKGSGHVVSVWCIGILRLFISLRKARQIGPACLRSYATGARSFTRAWEWCLNVASRFSTCPETQRAPSREDERWCGTSWIDLCRQHSRLFLQGYYVVSF